MTYEDRTSRYRETEVLSSSPERLIPLLYEQLLACLKRGSLCIERDDVEGRYKALGKASDIVIELISALDFEQGGDIAKRLASLYGFWAKEISEAGRADDTNRIDRVAEMVASLHESWIAAVRVIESGGEEVRPGTVAG